MSITDIEDRDKFQRYTDGIVHYRNLAIDCGAKPEQMLNAYDRKLCEVGLGDDEPGYWSQEDHYDECRDLWSLVLSLSETFKKWNVS